MMRYFLSSVTNSVLNRDDPADIKVLLASPVITEVTKADYDLYINLPLLKQHTSPKLAAYIRECETYMTEHIGDVKAPDLKSFILPSGKLDETAIETVIKDNQTKLDSITLLAECYLSWINLIQTGTVASLAQLPEDDYNKLNVIIDDLWKAEHQKERAALIAKLNATEAEFAVVDSYLYVVSSDEPDVETETKTK